MTTATALKRKLYRSELQTHLIPRLKGRIAIRNIEAVASLSTEAQQALAEALDAGLRQLTRATKLLKENSNASLEELLPESQLPQTQPVAEPAPEPMPQPESAPTPESTAPVSVAQPETDNNVPASQDVETLARMFLASIVNNTIAANSLARDETSRPLVDFVSARRSVFTSPAFSEITLILLCQFSLDLTNQLDQLIAGSPAYQQALRQSRTTWPAVGH